MFKPVNWPVAAQKIAGSKILVVGDLMLDHYRFGVVERLSDSATRVLQETPEKSIAMIGGGGNVMHNLRALGCAPQLAAVIGNDEASESILAFFNEADIEPPLILEGLGTLVRQRIIEMTSRQCIVRVDQGRAINNPFFGRETFEKIAIDKICVSDGVVISDYGYGVLTSEFTSLIIAETQRAGVPVIVAAKRPQRIASLGCTAIVMNLAEFIAVSAKWGLTVPAPVASMPELLDCVAAARRTVQAEIMVVTLSQMGAAVATEVSKAHIQDDAVQAHSTVGAGDVFVAALSALIIAGEDPLAAAATAVKAATNSTKTDVTCMTSVETMNDLMRCPGTQDLERLVEWRQSSLVPGQTVGLANGCFDKLHAGHLATLRWAKARCSALIVAINSDISVNLRKGEGRPIQPLAERVAALNALDCVDFVVAFDEDSPERLIAALRPDILVKGPDYAGRQIKGAELLHEWGGKLLISAHPFVQERGFSTTAIAAAEDQKYAPTARDEHSSDQPI